jgi:CheY-like chemotaxis protein
VPRILVIDDDQAVRITAKLVLEAGGFDVAIADSGMAGLRTAETDAVDLVVVDIFMPGMDGLETIRALRQRDPEVPIIAMSGSITQGMPDFLSFASKFGAAASLSKPFRPETLLDAVRTLVPGP